MAFAKKTGGGRKAVSAVPMSPDAHASVSVRKIGNGFIANHSQSDGKGKYKSQEIYHPTAATLPTVMKPTAPPVINPSKTVRAANPAPKMANLTAAARRALPKSAFAVPSKAPGPGSYPIPDKVHAAAAKSRAAQFGTPAVKAAVAKKVAAKGFEKSGYDVDKPGMKEGSAKDRASDRKQMAAFKKRSNK